MVHHKCPVCGYNQDMKVPKRHFLPIPYSNTSMLQLWEQKIGLSLDRSYYSHICSAHFLEEDYNPQYIFTLKNLSPKRAGRPILNRNAVPRMELGEKEDVHPEVFSSHPANRKQFVTQVKKVKAALQKKVLELKKSKSRAGPMLPVVFSTATTITTTTITQANSTYSTCTTTMTSAFVPHLAQAGAPLQNHSFISDQQPLFESMKPKTMKEKSLLDPVIKASEFYGIDLNALALDEPNFNEGTIKFACSTPLKRNQRASAAQTSCTSLPAHCYGTNISDLELSPIAPKRGRLNYSNSSCSPMDSALGQSLPISASLREMSTWSADDASCDSTNSMEGVHLADDIDKDDPTWNISRCEISEEDASYLEQEEETALADEEDALAEESNLASLLKSADDPELLIVSVEKLIELLGFAKCNKCRADLSAFQKFRTGAHFSFTSKCTNGHRWNWATGKVHEKKPVNNLLLASSLFTSGIRFAPMLRLAKMMKLAFIGAKTYYSIIEKYVKPILCSKWSEMRQSSMDEIRNSESQVDLSGDARFDSRGNSAKYAQYTIMTPSNNKIIDFVLLQKGLEEGEMESKGFLFVVSRTVNEVGADKLRSIVTDRNYVVGKKIKDNFPWLYHSFDLWHVSKGVNKPLGILSKRDPDIGCWSRSISNHLWFAAESCQGSEEQIIKIWRSLFHHVKNEHTWMEHGQEQNCGHGELNEAQHWKKWLSDHQVQSLEKMLTNTRMINQIKKCSLFLHTGSLESYHNLLLQYAPKDSHFSYTGMVLRIILSIFDHNLNIGRKATGTKTVYSRARKDWVEKTTFEPKDDSWRRKLVLEVVSFATTEPNLVEFDPAVEELLFPFHLPKNIWGVEKPTTETLLSRRRARSRAQ